MTSAIQQLLTQHKQTSPLFEHLLTLLLVKHRARPTALIDVYEDEEKTVIESACIHLSLYMTKDNTTSHWYWITSDSPLLNIPQTRRATGELLGYYCHNHPEWDNITLPRLQGAIYVSGMIDRQLYGEVGQTALLDLVAFGKYLSSLVTQFNKVFEDLGLPYRVYKVIEKMPIVEDYVNQVNAQKLAALKIRNWLLVGLGVISAAALVTVSVARFIKL